MASRALTLFRVGSAVSRVVPEPVAAAAAAAIAWGVAPLAGERRAQVERNLARVHGRPARPSEVRAVFESYARYWVESFRLPGTPPDVLAAGIEVPDWRLIEEALDQGGKGAILALPHLGAWEWAGFWFSACLHRPITVVVEALEPPDVYEWFVGLRESLGMHVVALGPDVTHHVMAALRDNHVLCLLSDRDLGGGGIEVEFFGERTTLPAGPATLALRTGSPLFPAAIYSGNPRRAVVLPALDTSRQGRLRADVTRVTTDLAASLEQLIRAAPEQWHLLQPNWPSDREASAAGPPSPTS